MESSLAHDGDLLQYQKWIEYVGYHRQLGFAPKGCQNSEPGFAFFSFFLYLAP